MAGIYIHVPFCAKRCIYCDFFSNTDQGYQGDYLQAVVRELALRKAYIGDEPVETIYLGGGTPTQLDATQLARIFDAIYRLFEVAQAPEITLEANPDDLTPPYIDSLHALPVNRISMGVQSFHDKDLRLLNRRHTVRQATDAVRCCRAAGYTNLSIDLIYGLPGQTQTEWEDNLHQAFALDIPHLSAYHLIYEEGTPLYNMQQAGKLSPVSEETSVEMFSLLIKRAREAGMIHYEISNFAKPGSFSRHNSAYWTGKKYLGIGPSAHSFDGQSRQCNVSSLTEYTRGVACGKLVTQIEPLDLRTRYNDYIITGLRTMWGIDLEQVRRTFGEPLYAYCIKQAAPYIESSLLRQNGTVLTLSEKGIFVSDGIMSDLLSV